MARATSHPMTDSEMADYFENGFTPGPGTVTDKGRKWLEIEQSLIHGAQLRQQVEEKVRADVAAAREHGAPWSLIGDALGVTGEAARQRYGSTGEARQKKGLPILHRGKDFGLTRKVPRTR
jgi:hypothetical protein